jgi:hypothetical protein
MIVIEKGTTNTICLSLRELSDINYPMEWQIVFTNEQSSDYVYTLDKPDTGTNSDYQEFELIEGTDITFRFNGDYEYKAYQKDNNLLVEQGMARVIESESITQFEVENTAKIYKDDN